MDVNVVRNARNAAVECGLSAIRFDFRGVRRSTGRHGAGVGEMQDLRAVVKIALELDNSNTASTGLHLMGYSFGAWTAVRTVAQGLDCASLSLIAPPLDIMEHPNLTLPHFTSFLIVSGDKHLLSLERYKRIPIVTASNFLDALNQEGGSGSSDP